MQLHTGVVAMPPHRRARARDSVHPRSISPHTAQVLSYTVHNFGIAAGAAAVPARPPIAAAVLSTAHKGLCCFHAVRWHARPQYRATWHPPHMQLRPDTDASSDSPDTLGQPGLLHMQGTANEHKDTPANFSCWAAAESAAVSGELCCRFARLRVAAAAAATLTTGRILQQ